MALGERLHQPQHLDELAFAPVAHAAFQHAAQIGEGRRQGPALQRRRLIERAGLLFNQRQIVPGIADELGSPIGSFVPRDLVARR